MTPAAALTAADARRFEGCIDAGAVALFPSDTVYGLASDPSSPDAVRRLYAIKGRPPEQPAAVMFFDLETALGALGDLGPRSHAALRALLPGPLTLVLPNPGRLYPLAGGPAPERLGLRVPRLEAAMSALAGVARPVLQSSANPSGGADARRLEDVDPEVRGAVDLALDGGELPGISSTVVDLTRFDESGGYLILREGAVSADVIEARLTVSRSKPWANR